jgi:delta-aminolevulinic acid dehydratase/porphobilinogen synthase
MSHAPYPALRLRRTRATGWSRSLHAEHRIGPQDLIWPLFVTDGKGVEDRDALVMETLMAFKRAGCSGVLTYHALHAARLMAR